MLYQMTIVVVISIDFIGYVSVDVQVGGIRVISIDFVGHIEGYTLDKVELENSVVGGIISDGFSFEGPIKENLILFI